MNIITHTTAPFDGQKPGTSGLRKKVTVFQQPHYLANFVASIFAAVKPEDGFAGKTLVIGGDGRFYNDTAIQLVIKISCKYLSKHIHAIITVCGHYTIKEK